MADYPTGVYSPRTKTNKNGVTYDSTKSTQIYAQDVTYLDAEVVAVETELGASPKGSHDSVKDRFDDDEAVMATKTGVETLTNKRITSRVQSVSDSATITPDADANDCVDITAIAQSFTIANPSGSPTNFQKLIIRLKDNATPQAITWGNGYVSCGVALPTVTVSSKILTLGFIYNTANSLNKWQLVASSQEA